MAHGLLSHVVHILLPEFGQQLSRLCPPSSQHPPNLTLPHSLFLPGYRPVSCLLTNKSNTYLQCTKVVLQQSYVYLENMGISTCSSVQTSQVF